MNQNRRANVSRHVWIYFSKAKCLEIVNHRESKLCVLLMKGNNCEYYWTLNGSNCRTIKKNVNYIMLAIVLYCNCKQAQNCHQGGEDVINGHKKQLVTNSATVASAIFCYSDQNAVKLLAEWH